MAAAPSATGSPASAACSSSSSSAARRVLSPVVSMAAIDACFQSTSRPGHQAARRCRGVDVHAWAHVYVAKA